MVATTVAALDRLSGGRFIFGAGLGGTTVEFERFGEDPDLGLRAAKLDEALEVVSRLWAGEKVDHHGPHYTVDGASLAPLPVQRPRPPIWIGGTSHAALRRASRWDGYTVAIARADGKLDTPPEVIADRARVIGRPAPFDIAVVGCSMPGDSAMRDSYEEAGTTWWLESIHDLRCPLDQMLARVTAGL